MTEKFTTEEKVSLLFKKNFGKPSTRSDIQFFQEPDFSSYSKVFTSQIWKDSASIPATVPSALENATTDDNGNNITGSIIGKSSGVIRRFEKVLLEHVSGSNNQAYTAYDGSGNVLLKNTIPFNFDASGSYLYTLYDNSMNVINFGDGEWVLDIESGILTFYHISDLPGVNSSNPPYISFYRYDGTFGIGSSSSSDSLSSNNTIQITSTNGIINILSQSSLSNAITINSSQGGFEIVGNTNSDITTNSGDLTITATDGILNLTSGNSSNQAIIINASNVAGGIDIDAGTTGVDITSTGSIKLNSAAASNYTVTGDNLSLETITSGNVLLDSAADVQIQSTANTIINNSSNTSNFQVKTSGDANAFYINGTTDNIGIGTNAPDSDRKLHVSGNVRIEGDLLVNGNYSQIDTNTSTTEQWRVTNDGTGPAVIVKQSGEQPIAQFIDSNVNTSVNSAGTATTSGSSTTLTLSSQTDFDNLQLESQLIIDSNTVYIVSKASSTPPYNITLDRNINISSATAFTYKLPFNALYIENSGNVGIGTNDPKTEFQVEGTKAIRIPVGTTAQRPSGSDALAGQIRYNTTSNTFEGYTSSSNWQNLGSLIDSDEDTYIRVMADDFVTDTDTIRFITNSNEVVRINSSGYLGIATNNPTYDLDVNGTVGINEYLYHNDNSNTFLRFQTNQITLSINNNSELDLNTYNTNLQSTSGNVIILSSINSNITATTGCINIKSNQSTATNSIDISSIQGGISLNAAQASNITTTGANMTIDTATSGNLVLTSAADVDVNATSAITLDANAASNLTTSSGDLTLEATAASLNLIGGEANYQAIRIHASNSAGGIDIDAGTAGIDATTTGEISLNATEASNFTSSNGDITIKSISKSVNIVGGESNYQAIRIYASDTAGGIDIDSGTNGINITTTGATNLNASAASNYTVSGDNLTLNTTTSGNLLLESAADVKIQPTTNLIINDSSNSINFQMKTSGDANTFYVKGSTDNIGIGTNNPDSNRKLHVSGNVRIEGDLLVNGNYSQIDTNASTTEQWRVTNDGTGPAVIVKQSGEQPIAQFIDSNANTSVNSAGTATTSGSSTTLTLSSQTDFDNLELESQIIIGSDTVYVISKSSSTPPYNITLDRELNISSATSFTYKLPYNALYIENNGNVGINTNDPAYDLDVNGDIRAQGNILSSGTITGKIGDPTSETYEMGITSGMTIADAIVTLDNWIYDKLLDSPPTFTNGVNTTATSYIKLDWSLPTQTELAFLNVNVPKISNIKIDYKLSSDTWSNSVTISSGSSDLNQAYFYVTGSGTSNLAGTTYNYYSLLNNTNYDFRVYGINESSSAALKYLTFSNLSSLPVGVPNEATSLTGTASNSSSISINWVKPSDHDITASGTNTVPDIDNYKVNYSAVSTLRYGGVITHSNNFTSTTTNSVINNLNPGQTYQFGVTTKNIINNSGGTGNDGYGASSNTVNILTNYPTAPNYLQTTNLNEILNLSTFRDTYSSSGVYKLDGTTQVASSGNIVRKSVVENDATYNNNLGFNQITDMRLNETEGDTSVKVSTIKVFSGPHSTYQNNPLSVDIGGFGQTSKVGSYIDTDAKITITSDEDYYSVATSEGFYKKLSFQTYTSNFATSYIASTEKYNIQIQQETFTGGSLANTNTSQIIDFYVEDVNQAPVVNKTQVNSITVASSSQYQFISGIPSINDGASFKVIFTVSELAHRFLRNDLKHVDMQIKDSSNTINLSNSQSITKTDINGSPYKYYTPNSNLYEKSTTVHNNGIVLSETSSSTQIQFIDHEVNIQTSTDVFDENLNVSITPYNIYGTGTAVNGGVINMLNGNSGGNIRIDTLSIKTQSNTSTTSLPYGLHVRSGYDSSTNYYPSGPGTGNEDFGDTYDNTADISSTSNPRYDTELQLVNGKYQTPGSNDGYKNYTTYYLFNGITETYPSYFNYSTITSSTNFRYSTFKYENLTNLSITNKITITFMESENFSDIKPSDLSLHIKVPTYTGWLDANKTVDINGVNDSNKLTDGTGCLSTFGSNVSTSTKKYCYLPLSLSDSVLYIRCGLKLNSNKKFRYIKVEVGFV